MHDSFKVIPGSVAGEDGAARAGRGFGGLRIGRGPVRPPTQDTRMSRKNTMATKTSKTRRTAPKKARRTAKRRTTTKRTARRHTATKSRRTTSKKFNFTRKTSRTGAKKNRTTSRKTNRYARHRLQRHPRWHSQGPRYVTGPSLIGRDPAFERWTRRVSLEARHYHDDLLDRRAS